MQRLLEIIDVQALELNDFSAALACYEAQTRKAEGRGAMEGHEDLLPEASPASLLTEGAIHDH